MYPAPKHLQALCSKIESGKRISTTEARLLYHEAPLSLLGMLADGVRKSIHGQRVLYNRNIHLEPTNICIVRCRFCSFSRSKDEAGCWDFSNDELLRRISELNPDELTEIHIVGGIVPSKTLLDYGDLLKGIKGLLPKVHIKAFTAIELDYMFRQAGKSLAEGLSYLRNCGLDSIPGGGAEIFDEDIRTRLCPEKGTADLWLNMHKTAHLLGIPSAATMLYGHIETFENRIHHLEILRNLQDETNGFLSFIPLKFRKMNNFLEEVGETSFPEDLRVFALSRIFLDNIPNLKAYWPMIGREKASVLLHFGANDLDGTILSSTKIYSMAGAEEQSPVMSVDEIRKLITDEGFTPAERDSLYNIID